PVVIDPSSPPVDQAGPDSGRSAVATGAGHTSRTLPTVGPTGHGGSTGTAPPPPSRAGGGRGVPLLQDHLHEPTVDTAEWGVYNSPTGTPPRSPSAVNLKNGELQIVGGFDAEGRDVAGGLASRRQLMYGRWEVRFRVDRGAGYATEVLLWPRRNADWPAA